MAIETTEEIERLIKAKVAAGEYETEAEVLSAALKSLAIVDEEVAAIEEGIADVRAGRTRPFEESDAEFREKHKIPRDA